MEHPGQRLSPPDSNFFPDDNRASFNNQLYLRARIDPVVLVVPRHIYTRCNNGGDCNARRGMIPRMPRIGEVGTSVSCNNMFGAVFGWLLVSVMLFYLFWVELLFQQPRVHAV